MKRLCLMRHAKSDWSNPARGDAERCLNERGFKSADFLAGFIIDQGWIPDHVLCSTAVRARSTVQPLAARLKDRCTVEFRENLYMAMPDTLLSLIHAQNDKDETLLIVAHNPGLEMLAVGLADTQSKDYTARMADHFPTGALAVFTFDIETWSDVKDAGGQVCFYGKPRELMAEKKTPV